MSAVELTVEKLCSGVIGHVNETLQSDARALRGSLLSSRFRLRVNLLAALAGGRHSTDLRIWNLRYEIYSALLFRGADFYFRPLRLRPLQMKHPAARLIGALVCVRAEIVALRLQ